MREKITIGTRGSKLALYQAHKVKDSLTAALPGLEVAISVIKTKGDKILDVALSKIGDKGLFTKELEVALAEKKIDIAVHSLKDLPTVLPEGLKLGAVLHRGEFRDALVSENGLKINDLNSSHTIATSSLRRQAALLKAVPDINIIDIRGNVETRIKKMKDGYCDGMIMAAAGLQRLGLDEYISEIIEPEIITPAVSQGIIAVEMRTIDPNTDKILSNINHPLTWIAARAERAFLASLEGGCQVPIGAYSKIENNTITLTGFVASVDGRQYLTRSVTGELGKPVETGEMLADILKNKGADKILKDLRL